jgi:hypothetical protein
LFSNPLQSLVSFTTERDSQRSFCHSRRHGRRRAARESAEIAEPSTSASPTTRIGSRRCRERSQDMVYTGVAAHIAVAVAVFLPGLVPSISEHVHDPWVSSPFFSSSSPLVPSLVAGFLTRTGHIRHGRACLCAYSASPVCLHSDTVKTLHILHPILASLGHRTQPYTTPLLPAHWRRRCPSSAFLWRNSVKADAFFSKFS